MQIMDRGVLRSFVSCRLSILLFWGGRGGEGVILKAVIGDGRREVSYGCGCCPLGSAVRLGIPLPYPGREWGT